MSEWIRAVLDLFLIGMIGGGLMQSVRLIRHLRNLQQGRVEMERFVREFNATVIRAEAGIKGLRLAARESGDDLEKLVEKATMLREELQFIIESADHLAERLTTTASKAARQPEAAAQPSASTATHSPTGAKNTVAATATPSSEKAQASAAATAKATPSSRAEQELLQALQKLS